MIWVLKCFSLSRLLTSYVVNSKPLSRDSAMDITDTVLAGKLRQVFFEGHINGKMNRWRIMQIPMSCTACSISSYISHTHTHTEGYNSSSSAPQAHGEANRLNLAAVPVMSE